MPASSRHHLQHREVGVEPLRRQQRAARRAGDAHDALDADALLLRLVDQRLQFARGAARRPAPAKSAELVVVERSAAAGARQHLGDQAAARMGHQVQRARRPAARAPASARWRSGSRPASGGRARRRDRRSARTARAPRRRAASTACRRCRRCRRRCRGSAPAAARRRPPAGTSSSLPAAALQRLERVGAELVDAGRRPCRRPSSSPPPRPAWRPGP